MTIARHSDHTCEKIGKSVKSSGWRRRAGDKSNEMKSAIGHWEEDFATPSFRHHRARLPWEETANRMDYDA